MIQVPREPNAGEPVSSLWGALVSRCLRAMRPMSSEDIIVQEGLGGVKYVLSNKAKKALVSEMEPSPFDVLNVPTTDGSQKIGIYCNSAVFSDILVTNNIAVTGLLASDAPDESDPGVFDLPQIGAKIWLEIKILGTSVFPGTPIVESIAVQHGTIGGGLWEEYPDPIAINRDNPPYYYQECFNLLIAEVTDYDSDPRPEALDFTLGEGSSAEHRQITQLWNKNVLLEVHVVNGIPCLVPADCVLNYPASPV
jgi:hypothetical protein